MPPFVFISRPFFRLTVSLLLSGLFLALVELYRPRSFRRLIVSTSSKFVSFGVGLK